MGHTGEFCTLCVSGFVKDNNGKCIEEPKDHCKRPGTKYFDKQYHKCVCEVSNLDEMFKNIKLEYYITERVYWILLSALLLWIYKMWTLLC